MSDDIARRVKAAEELGRLVGRSVAEQRVLQEAFNRGVLKGISEVRAVISLTNSSLEN